jgi:hypothetical protein
MIMTKALFFKKLFQRYFQISSSAQVEIFESCRYQSALVRTAFQFYRQKYINLNSLFNSIAVNSLKID